jgi:RNA polymerase sigma-70 factor, ECF subfamily
VDTAAPNPDEAVLPGAVNPPLPRAGISIRPGLLEELWRRADGAACGLSRGEFEEVLTAVGLKHRFGAPPEAEATAREREAFLDALHLEELALAHGCARGKDAAWDRFVRGYRAQLVRSATAITGSSGLGQELADSLYAELYGLKQAEGERRSPLASYSGRGSLAGWLRATLVQRFRDHHRRTHRESPLEDQDCAGPEPAAAPPRGLEELRGAVARTIAALAAEDRFLLAAYFLDRRTLLEIARMLAVHEATISRRLKRLLGEMRKQVLGNLERGGLSRRAAEEALGADPRDLEINLRALLQSSETRAFEDQRVARGVDGGSP